MTSSFYSQYYLWIKCKAQENKGNDDQFKKLSTVPKLFMSIQYKEISKENVNTDVKM